MIRIPSPSTLIVAVAFFHCATLAGRPALAADAGLGLEEDLFFSEIPSVYAASKREQKVVDAPGSVSIVTAEEIHQYGYRTLGDLLRSLRGFYVSNDRNYQYLGVRGFSLPGDYNTRTLVLIDGHRINDGIYNTAPIDASLPLDVDMIERVEVVRGPGSSLYGSNAFFGVINIISKRGRDLKGDEVALEAASLGTTRARLSLGDRHENGIEYLFSATTAESDGNPTLYYPEFDTPADNNGVAVDADRESFDYAFLHLGYRNFALEYGYGSRLKQIPTAPWSTVFNDNRTDTTDEHRFVNLNYQGPLYHDLLVYARVGLDRYRYLGNYVYDYGPPPDIVVNKDNAESESWTGELKLSQAVGRHFLTAGVEYIRNTRLHQDNYDVYGVYLNDDQTSSSSGLYVQDEITVTAGFGIHIGARHDHYRWLGNNTAPRLALIYKPGDNTALKVLYGEAFRVPNVYELYYHDGNTTAKAANALKAEQIRTTELIGEHYLSPTFLLTANLYRYRISDLIEQVVDPGDGLLVFTNMGESEANGLDLSVENRWSHGLEARLSYSYQDAVELPGNTERTNAPRTMIKLNTVIPTLAGKLRNALEVQYVSDRLTVLGSRNNGYVLTNLNLTAKPFGDRIEIGFSAYNLLDRRIADPASSEHNQDLIDQDGRRLRLSLSSTF